MMYEEENESEVLEMIKKLMEELSEKMEYSADDFEERLGRKKPASVSVDVIAAKPMKSLSHDEVEDAEESLFPKEEAEEAEKMGGMGYDEEDCDEDEEDGDEAGMLKKRLMRLGKG